MSKAKRHVHRFEKYEPTWEEAPWVAPSKLARESRFYRCSECGEPGFGIPPEYAKYLDDVEEGA